MKLRALLPLLAVFAACSPPSPMPDGGTAQTPVVTSVTPATGPAAGGTTVTVNGTNFVTGATVSFGTTASSTVTFESDRRLTAVTPAGTDGVVSVTVTNPGGKANTLMNAFTYTGTNNTTRVISEALLQNPADSTDSSGTATVSVTVVGHVQVATVTNGAGQGSGVRAQVGFSSTVGATPVQTDFTWTDATYVGDVDGPASGDLARDSYSGAVSLPAPTGNQAIYFLAVRFSVDEGVTWTLADRDGSSNGVLTTQLSKVTVNKASVEWCKLGGEVVEAPPNLMLRGSAAGPVIYGQVFKMGVTQGTGAGAGIKGALGYGPAGSDPSTWTWIDATFNTDTGGGANDEFQAMLPNPGIGAFKFAFRFSHADGPWSYCDADGLANNGFTEDQAGTLTVSGVGVDSCKLQFPDTLTSYQGRPSRLVYGRVFVQGLTEATGAAPGIEGQVGYGSASVPPSDASWTWSQNAVFNIDDGGGGDEYQASFTGPAPGTYAFAYRFRVGTGPWTYCDENGSMDGIQAGELGVLTAQPFDVQNCVLESTNSLQTVLPNTTSQPYTVLVNVPTLTDANGQGTPLTVQLGRGAPGADPATWSDWTNGSYTGDSTTADRYSATLMAPATSGSSAVAYRVQVGGRPYVYCDLDGSQNGFQQAQSGRLTVTPALIQSCKLETVSSAAIASGDRLTVTARTLIPGVSALAGASPNLRMQIGVGPNPSNASASALWGWQEATFTADISASGEDEFTAVTFPAYTGGRLVAARASLDGVAWTYCDLNGSATGGFEENQQYFVNVTNHATFDYCDMRLPGVADAGTLVYGQVYEPGLTPNGATPFIAQLGVGLESEDPGLGWRWSSATYNASSTTAGNNNEYQAPIPSDAGVGLRYVFRYSLDAGVWCYGDLDGSQNGFSGGSNIGLITP